MNFLLMGEATLTFPQTIHLRWPASRAPERRVAQAAEVPRPSGSTALRNAETLLEGDHACAGRFTMADISLGYAVMLALSGSAGRTGDTGDAGLISNGFRGARDLGGHCGAGRGRAASGLKCDQGNRGAADGASGRAGTTATGKQHFAVLDGLRAPPRCWW
ncbi:MAG: hypothetical protein R3E03_09215 [Novosphingobium sp.]